jgi:HD-GYP domain-containing protein (c-di-GMP phosphodiesterase class II)
VASDHHERVDGSGYPEGKKGDQINEYARLIAVVDSYEALTHARAYGSKLSPYQAIKIILEDKEKYDERFIKLLIEQISLYPIGSWVRLSTNEIGRVIHIDKASPLKPTVKIFFDPEGTKLPEAKAIDIAKHPSAYIKKAMDDGEIKSLLAETA